MDEFYLVVYVSSDGCTYSETFKESQYNQLLAWLSMHTWCDIKKVAKVRVLENYEVSFMASLKTIPIGD